MAMQFDVAVQLHDNALREIPLGVLAMTQLQLLAVSYRLCRARVLLTTFSSCRWPTIGWRTSPTSRA